MSIALQNKIESIQEEQNEIDSIKSSSRKQNNPSNNEIGLSGGFTGYTGSNPYHQAQKDLWQIQNENKARLQNNFRHKNAPIPMMKEGNSLEHPVERNVSQQIYSQTPLRNVITNNDGYEYTDHSGVEPHRHSQKSLQSFDPLDNQYYSQNQIQNAQRINESSLAQSYAFQNENRSDKKQYFNTSPIVKTVHHLPEKINQKSSVNSNTNKMTQALPSRVNMKRFDQSDQQSSSIQDQNEEVTNPNLKHIYLSLEGLVQPHKSGSMNEMSDISNRNVNHPLGQLQKPPEEEQEDISQKSDKLILSSSQKKLVVESILQSKMKYIEIRSQKPQLKQQLRSRQEDQDNEFGKSHSQLLGYSNSLRQDLLGSELNTRPLSSSQNNPFSSVKKSIIQGIEGSNMPSQTTSSKDNAITQQRQVSQVHHFRDRNIEQLNDQDTLSKYSSIGQMNQLARERQNLENSSQKDKTQEIKWKDNSICQSLKSLGQGSMQFQIQKTPISQYPKTRLSGANFFQKESTLERNQFWIEYTQIHKKELNEHYTNEKMRECSFTPTFLTNNFHTKSQVSHINHPLTVQLSLNPSFHKQASQMRSSYSHFHNFKKQTGFTQPNQQKHLSISIATSPEHVKQPIIF